MTTRRTSSYPLLVVRLLNSGMADGDQIDLGNSRYSKVSHRSVTERRDAPSVRGNSASSPSTSESIDELDWSWMEEAPEEERREPPPHRESMRRMQPYSPSSATTEETIEEGNRSEERATSGEEWPHCLSSMFACLGCTIGLFNISRFAVLSVNFGASFIIQFIILSFFFGLPLYAFHVSIGEYLGAGVIDMWRISPVFQGIGIALLTSQALLGIYSIVGVSWMFVYLRDSFITKNDLYRWAEPLEGEAIGPAMQNGTYKLEETVPDYFSGIVLQRNNLSTTENQFGHCKFQLVFNLAVVWMIVFVCLCKGLKSYGKAIYVFMPLGLTGITVLSIKIIGCVPFRNIFHETVWNEFFLNSKSWVVAAVEVFYTWGLLGACAMQITSHNAKIRDKKCSKLNRDTMVVALVTVLILVLAAFLANACVNLLKIKGNYVYIPSSFEKMSWYGFLWAQEESPLPDEAIVSQSASRYMTHVPLAMGEQVAIPIGPIHFGWTQSGELELVGDATPLRRSGYQTLRLATEIVPATLALLRAMQLSPFWAVLFYFTLIVLGIAQQLAIWHCVVTGITAIRLDRLKVWETSITFFTCAVGFLLGLPLTTELGIFIIHFVDYCIGCGWWIMVLYITELGSVLVIRGRPYGGENLVTILFPSLRVEQRSREDGTHRNHPSCLAIWAAPTLVFSWNVMLPVALMVLSITVFKNGNFRSLYNWSEANKIGPNWKVFDNPYLQFRTEDLEHSITSSYWPNWTRKIGTFLQLIPIMTVPLIAIIQTVRYLSSGSPDLFERIQVLYSPNCTVSQSVLSQRGEESGHSNGIIADNDNIEDPPPKYTPPPSYSTATGARLAKILRQSFRRSVRRFTSSLGDIGGSQGNLAHTNIESDDGPRATSNQISLSQHNCTSILDQEGITPPDYASVLVEIRQTLRQNINKAERSSKNECQSKEFLRDIIEVHNSCSFTRGDNRMSTATAESVATLLRSSQRRLKGNKSNVIEIPSNVPSSITPNSLRLSLRGSGFGAATTRCRTSESVECLMERKTQNTNEGSTATDTGEENLGLEEQESSSTAV